MTDLIETEANVLYQKYTGQMTIQEEFADKVVAVVTPDETILGLAVAGSWLTNEIDAFSDLDLILVTREKITGDKTKMLA